MSVGCLRAAFLLAAIVGMCGSFAAHLVAEPTSSDNTALKGVAAAPEVPVLSPAVADILKLTRAKISDDVIIAFIQSGKRAYDLTASEIIYLRKEGVSDQVLATMLNPSRPVVAEQAEPAPAPPEPEPSTMAPQPVVEEAPLPATTFVATEPAYAVYGAPSTVLYYPTYAPGPYWYDPWPWWYPSFTLGFYWGWGWGCGWGWGDCDDNHYCYNNNRPPPPPPNGGRPPGPGGQPPPSGGQRPPPGTQPPPGGTRPPSGTQPSPSQRMVAGSQAPGGRTPSTANRTYASGGTARPTGTTAAGRSASLASNSGSASAASRPTPTQARAAVSNSRQAASRQVSGPTSHWTSSANSRPVVGTTSARQGVTRVSGSSRSSGTTRVWSNPAGTVAAGGSRRYAPVSSGSRPTTVWSSSRSVQRPTSYVPANRSITPTSRSSYVRSSPVGYSRSVSSFPRYVGSSGTSFRPSYSGSRGGSSFRPSAPSFSSRSFSGGSRGFSGSGSSRGFSGGGSRGGHR